MEYSFDIQYRDNSEVKLDTGWSWGTIDTLDSDRGEIYKLFVDYLKRGNLLRKMKGFKILGLVNIKEIK